MEQWSVVSGYSQRVGRKGERMQTVFGLHKNRECVDQRVCVSFLRQIAVGDEKWILYNKVEWKRSWGK